MQLGDRSKGLYGCDVATVCLDREHQTRPNSCTIDNDGASAAHAVLAANVSAVQVQIVSQKIAEQQSRCDGCAPLFLVYLQRHFNLLHNRFSLLKRLKRTSTSLAGAITRVAQSPVNQRLSEISAVLRRAVNIRGGIDCCGTGRGSLAQRGIICRFAEKFLFGPRQTDCTGPYARKRD